MNKHRLFIAALVMLGIVVCAAVPSLPAYADNRSPSNTAEQNAYNLCYWGTGTKYGARGAIWFTNSGSYYNDSVTVSSDAQSVSVAIRGSVYGCKYGSPGDIYATNVAPNAPNAALLSGLSSTTLYSCLLYTSITMRLGIQCVGWWRCALLTIQIWIRHGGAYRIRHV